MWRGEKKRAEIPRCGQAESGPGKGTVERNITGRLLAQYFLGPCMTDHERGYHYSGRLYCQHGVGFVYRKPNHGSQDRLKSVSNDRLMVTKRELRASRDRGIRPDYVI